MSENKNDAKVSEQKTKQLNRILSILIAVLLTFIGFLGGYFARYFSKTQSEKTIEELISIIIDKAYPNEDGKEIDEKAVFEFFKSYYDDDYAAYYDKEEYERLKRENSGNYSGIGVSFYSDKVDTIAKVLKNSPAYIAGFQKGDVFLSITNSDGVKTTFDKENTVLDYLPTVNEGESITVEINRKGETLQLQVEKRQYNVSYVEYYDSGTKMYFADNALGNLEAKTDDNFKMSELDDLTAYITLDQFEGQAGEEFGKAIEFMEERGRTKLILELRDNGGGSMNVLVKIASYLIYNSGERESIVAYAKAKDRTSFFSTASNNYYTGITKTVVIANHNTASASECLIGAMLHYGKAGKDNNFSLNDVVLTKNSYGEAKTFGKGIMQTTYELKSGGAFKLTTAKIYWPDNKTTIHGEGIVQDVNELNAVSDSNALIRAIEIAKNS